MKAFDQLESEGLHWVQPGFGMRYELRNDRDEVIATMQRRSWWNSIAEVDMSGSRWIFDRKGFWRHRVIIRSVGTGDEPAEFAYNFHEGRLEFPDGRIFLWKRSNFWGTNWAWTTPNGEPILGFKTSGILKMNAEIVLEPDVFELKSQALLTSLGWYLITLFRQDSAAAA